MIVATELTQEAPTFESSRDDITTCAVQDEDSAYIHL